MSTLNLIRCNNVLFFTDLDTIRTIIIMSSTTLTIIIEDYITIVTTETIVTNQETIGNKITIMKRDSTTSTFLNMNKSCFISTFDTLANVISRKRTKHEHRATC